ncbi:MAG TPA: acyl-ACP--UDP-N-acetylglucosamine O-acyltransferase [Armatimonadota bacterium]|jgi:UDP-N-acetylglucosamine acyltransferase|nr:acyl-ACP--UDP-N-acetylglucosamine O-acyltransferase [Armatimonadota bacterium]
MPNTIHPTAIIAAGAELGDNVTVGPYALIDDNVTIGDDCVIDAQVRICSHTSLGNGNHLHQGTVLGDAPQDGGFEGEVSYLKIGDNNQIREYCTLHRASGEGESTSIGSDCMLMAYSHIGHNCDIGSSIMMANYTGISGHCVVEDFTILSGFVGVHQFITIGTMAMIGGMSRVVVDVPPYCIAQGNPADLYGLNVVGLRRRGLSEESRRSLKATYRALFRSTDTFEEAQARIRADGEVTPETERLLAFQAAIATGRSGRQRDPRADKS